MPMGVTDGSNAMPGQVGEFITAMATIAWQANVPLSTQVSVITIPPGDWDAWSLGNPSASFTAIDFYLPTVPPGVQHAMGQDFYDAGQVTAATVLNSPPARINVTVPTTLTFLVTVQSTVAGTLQLVVSARRMR